MTNGSLMRRSEAEKYIRENGYKLFLDMCVRDRLLVLPDRKIIPLFREHYLSGVIELETWSDMGLTLKINGEIVYQHNK